MFDTSNLRNYLGLALIMWSLIGVHALYGQKVRIEGTVTDQRSGEPLPGVNILLDGKAVSAADKEGHFEINVEPGTHTLGFRYISYRNLDIPVNAVRGTIYKKIGMLPSELLLDQVVVSAGKREEALKEVTVSLDLINANQIKSQQTITMDDALERASGISIIDGQPNIRGGSGYSYGAGSRVLLLLNDMPILRADAGYPAWNYLPVENVDRVEIIKGASSVLYGSAALNGIINMHTAWPGDSFSLKAGFFNALYSKPAGNSYTVYDTMWNNGQIAAIDSIGKELAWWQGDIPFYSGMNVLVKAPLGHVDLVLGMDGYLEDSYLKGGYVRRGRSNLSFRYRPENSPWIMGIHANFMKNRNASFFFWEDDSSGIYKPFSGTLTHSNSTLYNIDPFLKYYGKKGWNHTLQGRYFSSDIYTNDGKGTLNDIWYGEYRSQKSFDRIGLKTTAGIAVNANRVDAELYGNAVHSASNQALFFQLDKTFFTRLKILGGLRWESNRIDNESPESKLVKRFGLNLAISEYTYLRASYGEGYRFPTIAEKFVRTNVGALGIFPNPGLQSESGWSSELGLKQAYKLRGIQGFIDFAAFYSTYINMMEFVFGVHDGNLGFSSQNVGDTEIKGVEIMILGEGRAGKSKVSFNTGYTYIDPKYANFDSTISMSSSVDYNILKYRSRHTFKSNVAISRKHWNLSFHSRYYSFMEAVDRIFEALLPGIADYRKNNQHGEWVFDFSANYHLNHTVSFNLNINNVFSNVYSLRPGLMEAPRSISLGLNVDI